MSFIQKTMVLFLVLPLIFFFAGCGSNNNHSTTSGSSGSSSGSTGSSGGSSGSSGSGATGSTPTGTTGQSASAKFLYSSDFNGNRVLGYLVNATNGSISATRQGSAPTHTGPTRIAADSTGTHLYVINQTSKDLSAYSISRADGSLTSVPGSPFAVGQIPTSVAVAPSGAFVYLTTLTSVNTPTSFVYAFSVQSNGSLTPVPGSPFATVDWARALAVDPQGKFLYVSSYPESTTTSISQVGAFSISSDGALTPIPGSPYTEPNSQSCANGAWDVAIHPSGNFLLLPNECEGTVIYRIDRTAGTLSLINGSPFAPPGEGFVATGDVQSIAMDPQGTYFWVTDSFCDSGCSMATDTWKLNTSTGVATFLESGIAGCGLLARSDPSGSFLYEIGDTQSSPACGGTENSISGIWGFNVNRGTGALGNISGSPWQSSNTDGSFSVGLAITP